MIDVRCETAGSNLIPRRITKTLPTKQDEKYVGKCNVGYPGQGEKRWCTAYLYTIGFFLPLSGRAVRIWHAAWMADIFS